VKPSALNRTTVVPLYHQLKEILLEEIRSGKLKPNDRLPPEDQVAEAYGVSTITVRRTLMDLAAEGYIRREQGRGTFVSPFPLEQGPRELTSFSSDIAKRGLVPTSVVLKQEVVEAEEELAAHLKVPPFSEIFLLRRMRLADGEPLGIQSAHVPLQLAPGLMDEDFGSGSLYATLQQKFGLAPVRAREVYTAAFIAGEEAQILRMQEGSLGLAAKRWTLLADGRTCEFVSSIMRADRYEVSLDLIRP